MDGYSQFPQPVSQPNPIVANRRAVLPLISSLPNLNGPLARAGRASQAEDTRRSKTHLLDRYMARLRGLCPYHFVLRQEFAPEHFSHCDLEPKVGNYSAYRRSFEFGRFTYCYKCGLPQDRSHNGEAPKCHLNVGYTKECPFSHFIYRAVFCLWQDLDLRSRLRQGLGISQMLSSDEEFAKWAREEKRAEGNYTNLLEAFLWFCGELERSIPDLFK